MARKKPVIGRCRACGKLAEMSWEHVPPRAAPNKGRHIRLTFEQAINLGPDDVPRGEYQQGGVQFPTICGVCNNKFGRLYVPGLLEWYRGGHYALSWIDERGFSGAQFTANGIYPLRIIKGIIAMFMAINPERFILEPAGKALAESLDNPEATGLPSEVRIFVYFNHTGSWRYIPLSLLADSAAVIELVKQGRGPEEIRGIRLSEITFPPYGFVMTIGSIEGLDERLFEISHFADFGYDDQIDIPANIPLLETHSGMAPNDYRTYEQWRTPFGTEDEESETA